MYINHLLYITIPFLDIDIDIRTSLLHVLHGSRLP